MTPSTSSAAFFARRPLVVGAALMPNWSTLSAALMSPNELARSPACVTHKRTSTGAKAQCATSEQTQSTCCSLPDPFDRLNGHLVAVVCYCCSGRQLKANAQAAHLRPFALGSATVDRSVRPSVRLPAAAASPLEPAMIIDLMDRFACALRLFSFHFHAQAQAHIRSLACTLECNGFVCVCVLLVVGELIADR